MGAEHIPTSSLPQGYFVEAAGHLHLDSAGSVIVSLTSLSYEVGSEAGYESCTALAMSKSDNPVT